MKRVFLLLLTLCICLCGCTPAKKSTSGETPAAEVASTPEAYSAEASTDGTKLLLSSKAYVDIIKSGDYFMKAKIEGENGINEFSVSVSKDSTAMETLSDGMLYNTVIKDGITYMIDHQTKYVITSGAEVAASASKMEGETLSAEGITLVKSDRGAFRGETLPYDEYETPSGETMRFYLRENALAGIEVLQGENTVLYEITELSNGHKEAMHEIPADYMLVDMAALGG